MFPWVKILAVLLLLLPAQFGRHFWLKDSFIFGLKVDYLSPTLYLQDIIIFFLIILKRKEIIRFLKPLQKSLITYHLLLITNIFFSLTPLLSMFSWIRISEFVLFGLIVSQNKQMFLNILGRILPFIIVFEFLLGSLQLLNQSSIGGIFWFLGERSFNILTPSIAKGTWLGMVFLRPYGTFSHPNSLAGFVLVSAILLVGIKRNFSIFDKLSLACGFLLIVLCFSRTVWLTSLVLSLFFIVNKIFSYVKTRKISLNFLYFFSLITVLVAVFLFVKTTIEASSFENRIKLAEHALYLIKEYPLFGVGANNFIISLSAGTTSWQWYYWLQPVHNIFLLVASETGLVGFLFFSAFLGLAIRQLRHCYLFRNAENRATRCTDEGEETNFPATAGYRISLLCGSLFFALFAILFTGLFDHYWLTLIQNQLLFIIVVGLSLRHKEINE